MIQAVHFVQLFAYGHEVALVAHVHQVLGQLWMLFEYVILVIGALNALEHAVRTFVLRLFAVHHLVAPKCIVVVRFVVAVGAVEPLPVEVCHVVGAERVPRVEHFAADLALERVDRRRVLGRHRGDVSEQVLLQVLGAEERVAALRASADRRLLRVNAPVVLQLLCVFERLVAHVALEVPRVRVDLHVRVAQPRQDRRLEGAVGAAVQLHVDVVLAPEVGVQGVPVPAARLPGRALALGTVDPAVRL